MYKLTSGNKETTKLRFCFNVTQSASLNQRKLSDLPAILPVKGYYHEHSRIQMKKDDLAESSVLFKVFSMAYPKSFHYRYKSTVWTKIQLKTEL